MLQISDILNSIKTTPWLQQIAAIVTIIGIPFVIIKLFFYKARHKIYFKPDETYDKVRLVDIPGAPWSIWLHLHVKNNGYEISKNAEGYLCEIWVKKSNNYQKLHEFKAPVKLKWAHEKDIQPIDILPKETRRLDICYIYENNNMLYIEAEGFPSGTIKNQIPPGDYLFVIKAVSENSLIPSEFIFNISWDGQWGTIKGKKYVRSFKIYQKPLKPFFRY